MPTVKIDVTIDGFTVNIAAEAENGTLWSWNYGDGNTSDSTGSHTYTYAAGGEYTISCTVTGDGGSTTVTETVTIATIEEMLTAHPWVLADAGNNGLGFHITPDLLIDFPAPGVLGTIDLLQNDTIDLNPGYDYKTKYNDVFTFATDGAYGIDTGGETMIG